jgi:hypothetical protein
MNAARKNDTVTITLSVEDAAVLVATLQISRDAAMNELCERLIGSPKWRFVRDKQNAHAGVIDIATYNRVVEARSL